MTRSADTSNDNAPVGRCVRGCFPLPDDNPKALLSAAHRRCLAVSLAQTHASPGANVKFAVQLNLDNIPVRGWKITDSHLVFCGNAGDVSGGSTWMATSGISIPRVSA